MALYHVVHADLLAPGHDHAALNGVLQLPHIAWPLEGKNPIPCVIGEAGHILSIL